MNKFTQHLYPLSSETSKKLIRLNGIITKYHKIAIAFSGGVDSSLLLYLASRIRPVVAIMIKGPMVPESESKAAISFAQSLANVTLVTFPIDILSCKGFTQNGPERCYYCKRELFEKITKIAQDNNCDVIFDGSNIDDLSDYRPGMKAIKELGIKSPFVEAEIDKSSIYNLSNYYDLPTKNKPAAACLASRIKTNIPITKEMLEKIEKGEEFLKTYFSKQLRLRLKDENNGYIEIDNNDFNLFYNNRDKIKDTLAEIGITIEDNPREYKRGSMNL